MGKKGAIFILLAVSILLITTIGIMVIGYLSAVQSGRAEEFNRQFVYNDTFVARSRRARLSVQQITDQLQYPWGIAIMPDQRTVLITEKLNAIIKEVDLITGKQQAVARVEEVSPLGVGTHCGLLDITLHPDFARNNYVYLSYTVGDEVSDTIRPRIARAKYENHRLTELAALLTVDVDEGSADAGTCGMRFAWHPDGTLLASIGNDERDFAQQLDSLWGKIVRINDDGSVPADNPFVGYPGAHEEIFSLGHRDPQGLIVSRRAPYTIWSSEHGPHGGDELNRVVAGNNYGWAVVSYGVEYVDRPKIVRALTHIGLNNRLRRKKRDYIGGTGTHAEQGFAEPVVNWGENGTGSIAPSGMIRYSGKMFPEWEGDMLIATLTTRHIRRVKIENGQAIEQEEILRNKLGRIRHLAEMADGSILAITDSSNGRLFRITRR